jgi:hypothetical protein
LVFDSQSGIEGAEHGLGGFFAEALRSSQSTLMADRLKDRLDGKPVQTKRRKVDALGQFHESTFEKARKSPSVLLSFGFAAYGAATVGIRAIALVSFSIPAP